MQYPKAFVRTLSDLLRHSIAVNLLSFCVCLSLLSATGLQRERFNKMLLSLTGVATSVVGLLSYRDYKKLVSIEMLLDEIDYKALGQYYNEATTQLPVEDKSTVSEPSVNRPQLDVAVPDILSYWKQTDKHLLIVGGTGDGKSTFIKALVNFVSNEGYVVSVYDTHATIDDYTSLPRNQVLSSFSDIESAMQDDLTEMEQRLKERGTVGWRKWATTPRLMIGEEFSTLASEIKTLPEWINKLAKQSRKLKLFMVLAVQNDTVSNLGLKGDIKIRDTCFTTVYLGKAAINRVSFIPGLSREDKKILIAWLQDPNYKYQRCLVDDKPALTPAPVSC
jgi:energy-coupling factor transporter ATP-binding protein EcfA2